MSLSPVLRCWMLSPQNYGIHDLSSLLSRMIRRKVQAHLLGFSALQHCIARMMTAESWMTVELPTLLYAMAMGQILPTSPPQPRYLLQSLRIGREEEI